MWHTRHPLGLRAFLVAGMIFGSALPALADEQFVPLALSGAWKTYAHRPSMVASPDVCLTGNLEQGLLFRADAERTELRVINPKWSLPPDVQGEIKVSVGAWSNTLTIRYNTATMVSAPLDPDDLIPMFAAMDKAASMTVTAGKAPSTIVSLAGSTRATDAFRTCAGIRSNSGEGSNPFK